MNKKNIGLIGGLLFTVVGLLVADYLGLFGVKSKQELDFVELIFKPRDAKTGAPIYDAHATCYQHRNHEICSERESKRKDIITIHFPIYRKIQSSFIFKQDEEVLFPLQGNINIMIIHVDYQKDNSVFDVNQIYQNPGQVLEIKLKAVDWNKNTSE